VRKALVIGFIGALLSPSLRSARSQNLGPAVRATESAWSFRYAIAIAVARTEAPTTGLSIQGVRGRGQLFVHVRQIPGRDAAAMIDGPFLYERAPSGVVVNRTIRWLRMPIASIGPASTVINAVRSLTPFPLLRVLGESHARATGANAFAGTVNYDDPIVRSAALAIKARLYAFGRPVHLTPPAEGTFVDQQLLQLAE
jgi:hypothetical protein